MDTAENGEARVRPKPSKIYVGSSGPSIWREGMEVANPIVEGLSPCFFLSFISAIPNLFM
jgi:actin-like protein 6A